MLIDILHATNSLSGKFLVYCYTGSENTGGPMTSSAEKHRSAALLRYQSSKVRANLTFKGIGKWHADWFISHWNICNLFYLIFLSLMINNFFCVYGKYFHANTLTLCLLLDMNNTQRMHHLTVSITSPRPQCWSKPSRARRRTMMTRSSCTTSRLSHLGRRSKKPSAHWKNIPTNADSWPWTRPPWRMSWTGTSGSSRMKITGESGPSVHKQSVYGSKTFWLSSSIVTSIELELD